MTSQIASSTDRPEKVLVANWWNPPFLLPLVEVVRGPDTSDETVETATAIFESVGKKPVVLAKESLGFIGNRMQFALLREALSIVDKGIASAEDVDTVVKTSFGRRLAVAGPLRYLTSLAGIPYLRLLTNFSQTLIPVQLYLVQLMEWSVEENWE